MTVLPRTQTNLPIILWHIRQLLLDNLVYTDSCVFLATQDENKLPPDINYCEIIPGKQNVINPETGYLASVVEGEIFINVYQRFWLDPANRATIQLTDQNNGILQKLNLINLVLNLQELQDGNNWILCNPLHLMGQEDIKDKEKWKGVRLRYLARYGYDPTAYSSIVGTVEEFNYEFNCEYDTVNITNNAC